VHLLLNVTSLVSCAAGLFGQHASGAYPRISAAVLDNIRSCWLGTWYLEPVPPRLCPSDHVARVYLTVAYKALQIMLPDYLGCCKVSLTLCLRTCTPQPRRRNCFSRAGHISASPLRLIFRPWGINRRMS